MKQSWPKDKYITKKILEENLLKETKKEQEQREIITEVLQHNHRVFENLKKHQEETEEKVIVEPSIEELPKKINHESKKEIRDVSFYLNQLKYCKNIEELPFYLPKPSTEYFTDLMNTILANFLKECQEIERLILFSKMTSQEKADFRNEITIKRKYIDEIIKFRNLEVPESKEEHLNHIIYLNSLSGNSYFYNDLKAIDPEYYESFGNLIKSIRIGTFKNAKTLTNNNKMGVLSEVKDFKTRVIFDRVNIDTYCILCMLIKKTDWDSFYQEKIQNRVKVYSSVKKDIKELCKNELYIEQNDEMTLKMIRKLKKEETNNE